jgi:hypothetical protein
MTKGLRPSRAEGFATPQARLPVLPRLRLVQKRVIHSRLRPSTCYPGLTDGTVRGRIRTNCNFESYTYYNALVLMCMIFQ